MVLEKLEIINFKNIHSAEFSFASGINSFVGANGSGKTNLLDAIYFLSITKSAQGLTDSQAVNHDADFFMLQGQYGAENRHESVVCSFKKRAGKTLKRNGKEYGRMSEHIGLIPVIFSSPSDTTLINEASDQRRRFLNASLSQIDSNYLMLLVRYNHFLAERNKLLKMGRSSGELLEVIDMQMVDIAHKIHSIRREFIEELAPIAQQLYAAISGGREEVMVAYKSALDNGDYATLLQESLQRDQILGHTSVGIHRDDMPLEMEGLPIRKFGSQGQQKSMLLSLKLSLAQIIYKRKQIRPLLLLDDVFDKLDMQRVENLLAEVSRPHFGQIFITDSNKVRLEGIVSSLEGSSQLYTVDNGAFTL